MLEAKLHMMLAKLHMMLAKLHMMLHRMLAKLHMMLAKLHTMEAKLHMMLAKLHTMLAKLHMMLAKLHRMLAKLHMTLAKLHMMLEFVENEVFVVQRFKIPPHPETIIYKAGFRSLGEGEEVEFKSKPSEKGIEATFVCGVGGAECRGSDRRPMSRKKFRKISIGTLAVVGSDDIMWLPSVDGRTPMVSSLPSRTISLD
ncbi:hypothetical protein ACOMHN_060079 [Nucella lapillus]